MKILQLNGTWGIRRVVGGEEVTNEHVNPCYVAENGSLIIICSFEGKRDVFNAKLCRKTQEEEWLRSSSKIPLYPLCRYPLYPSISP